MRLCRIVALELADEEQRTFRGLQLKAVAGDGDVEAVEGQSRCTICLRPLNGNIAIVGITRRLVGRGAARHRADDLAARGGNIVFARRAVHAVKLVIARYRDIALHRAAVQVEAEILVVDADSFLGGVVQHLDVLVVFNICNRFLQGVVFLCADRRDILHPCAVAAILAFAVGKGIAGFGTRGWGVAAVGGVFQLGGGDEDVVVCYI